MRFVSSYITSLFEAITDDLRSHIDPEKLQFEVDKEVEKQLLSQLVTAISERNNCISWDSDLTKCDIAQKKVVRHMKYVNEYYAASQEVKLALASGDSDDRPFAE